MRRRLTRCSALAATMLLVAGCREATRGGTTSGGVAVAGGGVDGGGAAPAPVRSAMLDPARDRVLRPDALVARLGLAPGMTVADLGAGPGYLTLRLARAVGPGGRVIATDVDAAALATLRARVDEAARAGAVAAPPSTRASAVAARDSSRASAVAAPASPHPSAGPGAGLAAVETRLVARDDPGLAPASVDLALLCHVDAQLPDAAAWLRRLAPSLRPGARLAVIGYLPGRAPLLEAAARAGYRLVDDAGALLPMQFFVLLSPSPSPSPAAGGAVDSAPASR